MADGARGAVRWRRVLVFYALVYAVSYGLVGGFLVAGGSFHDASWVLFAQVSALTPALMALALCRWLWRVPLRDALALRLGRKRWLLVAWLLPWVLTLLTLAFGRLMPGVGWDPSLQPAVERNILSPEQLAMVQRIAAQVGLPPLLLLVPMGLIFSVTLSFVAGCGEELGWRGLVHEELRPLGFWGNTLLTGLLWLGWHLPLLALGYGYPQHPRLGAALMAAHILVSSISLAYLRERAGSSLAAGLFHGTSEATLLLAVAPLAGGSDLAVGLGSASAIAAQVAVAVGLLAHDRLLAREPLTRRRP